MKTNREQDADMEDVAVFKRRLRNKTEKVFLSLEDAASLLLVEYRTVWRLVRSGKLTAGKIGGQWRVYSEDLYTFFRECCKYRKEKEIKN